MFLHPSIRPEVFAAMPAEKAGPKIRALTVKALAEAVVTSLSGRRAILLWDQFDQATPTELAWLHQFLAAATMVVATTDPLSPKLKPLLDRIPGRIELEPLSEAESGELIERCMEIAPFAVSHPAWYRQEIWRKSRGNPRAIKDLLGDHALEKVIDSRFIRGMQNEQGARYWAISWLVLIGGLLFSIHRYVGRGLGDRDAYIIGAVGMVTFLFLGLLVRRANTPERSNR